MILTLLLALSALAANSPTYDRTAPVVIRSDIDKSSQPLVTAPGNYVEKDAESIQQKVPDSLKAAIGLEPNVQVVGSPRATAELPQIRGLGAERILVLDEGVRQNYQSGHNGRIFSDFSLMERIEIVNVPYSDSPNYYRSLNVTCNPAELQLSLRKQREDVAKAIAQHEEYQRVPKGARILKRKLELDKADTADTRRINH